MRKRQGEPGQKRNVNSERREPVLSPKEDRRYRQIEENTRNTGSEGMSFTRKEKRGPLKTRKGKIPVKGLVLEAGN